MFIQLCFTTFTPLSQRCKNVTLKFHFSNVVTTLSVTWESGQMEVMVRFRKIGFITSVNNSKSPIPVDTLPLTIFYIITRTMNSNVTNSIKCRQVYSFFYQDATRNMFSICQLRTLPHRSHTLSVFGRKQRRDVIKLRIIQHQLMVSSTHYKFLSSTHHNLTRQRSYCYISQYVQCACLAEYWLT